MSNVNKSDAGFLEAIKAGRHEMLDELYKNHRAAFITYAQRQLGATEEDAADCFQDAVIAFYKNVVSGRLTELTCEIRTYLFSIGKRMVYRRNMHRKREILNDSDDKMNAKVNPLDELDLSLYEQIEHDHQKQILRDAMALIGDRCRETLTLFYYHRYSIESIQNTLNYNSAGAVRIKKMRCLEELKQIITKSK